MDWGILSRFFFFYKKREDLAKIDDAKKENYSKYNTL